MSAAVQPDLQSALPLVSILIPVAGEAERIGRCLDSVLAQVWPADRLEVVVVDGAPGDGTGAVARRALATRPEVRSIVVDNPGGGRSANLNRALAAATGEIVCRVDARSALPSGYVRTCATVLQDAAVAVVGGSQVAIAPEQGTRARGVARGLNNRLAMGMAHYRRQAADGPADTVYLGAFRAGELRSAGGWDEALAVNEDFDLNRRMSAGGAVWYASDLAVEYLPRTELGEIAQQYWGFGRWKVRYLRTRRARPRIRQVVGMSVLPVGLAAGGAVVASRRPWAWVLGGLAAALVIEDVGASHAAAGRAPLSVRLWSLATCAVVVVPWSAGTWRELAHRPSRSGS